MDRTLDYSSREKSNMHAMGMHCDFFHSGILPGDGYSSGSILSSGGLGSNTRNG